MKHLTLLFANPQPLELSFYVLICLVFVLFVLRLFYKSRIPNAAVERFIELYAAREAGSVEVLQDPVSGKYIIERELEDYLYERYHYNYRYVSGILTALGVLGTFLGIASGLSAQPDLTDLQKTKTFIDGLLAGMHTAFNTSIIGILFSVVFLLFHEALQKYFHKRRNGMIDTFYREWVLESPVLYLRTQNYGFAELKEVISDFKQATDKMNAMVEPENLGKLLAESMEKTIKEQLTPSMQKIADTSLGLQETNAKLADYITVDLPAIFSSIQTSLDSSNASIQDTNRAVLLASEGLQITKENLDKQNQAMQNLDQMLQTYISGFEKVLQEQRELFTQQVESVTEASKQVLQISGQEVTEVIEGANAKIQSTLKGVGDSLLSTGDLLQQELAKFQAAYQKSIQGFIQEQNDLLEKTLGQQVQELQSLVDSFATGLSDNYTNFLQLQEKNQESLQRFESFLKLQKDSEARVKEELFALIEKSESLFRGSQIKNEETLRQTDRLIADYAKFLNDYMEKQTGHLTEILTHLATTVEVIGASELAKKVSQ
ncbi:MAG: MotA/TolQ/ExbB proton channel family protein [Spirochaetota bacterium]